MIVSVSGVSIYMVGDTVSLMPPCASVGWSVGSILGMDVGRDDGLKVGSNVGSSVGILVGSTVECLVAKSQIAFNRLHEYESFSKMWQNRYLDREYQEILSISIPNKTNSSSSNPSSGFDTWKKEEKSAPYKTLYNYYISLVKFNAESKR